MLSDIIFKSQLNKYCYIGDICSSCNLLQYGFRSRSKVNQTLCMLMFFLTSNIFCNRILSELTLRQYKVKRTLNVYLYVI